MHSGLAIFVGRAVGYRASLSHAPSLAMPSQQLCYGCHSGASTPLRVRQIKPGSVPGLFFQPHCVASHSIERRDA